MKNIMNDLTNHTLYKKSIAPILNRFMKKSFPPTNPVLMQHLQALEKRFQGALSFLTNNFINKEGQAIKLHSLPWYLMIGLPKSGKTSLLVNSSIHYLLGKSQPADSNKIVSSSDTCDWWATREAVFIDIPGNYTTTSETVPTLSNKLWKHFLNLTKDAQKQCRLNGVIFTLSLADLMDKSQLKKMARHFKHNAAMLTAKFNHRLSFYITITKCDLLPGFIEFFSDSSSDELAQAWGITLPEFANNTALLETTTRRFDALISRLNKQIIWRLHQEKHPFIKAHIKDFPLQVERLKNTFIEFLTILSPSSLSFDLKGIYLTSADQQPPPSDTNTSYPQIMPADNYPLPLAILHNPVTPMRPYFIKQFLLQAVAPNTQINYLQSKQKKLSIVYAVISLAIIASVLMWFKLNY